MHPATRSRTPVGVPYDLPAPEPEPYLPALGAVSLRFRPSPPPPDLVTRPVATAPPFPALTPTESTIAQANVVAAQSAPASPPTPPETIVRGPNEPTAAPPALLPDDTRPSIRPEDFLPFFQIPGTGAGPGDVTLVVPAPRLPPTGPTLPPSSATYTQTPK